MKTLLLTIQCVLFLSSLFCLLVIFYGPVQAQARDREQTVQIFETGRVLLEDCEAHIEGGTWENVANGNACAGYIIGIDDVQVN